MYSYPLPALAASDKEECACEFHTTLHPVSGVYPSCKYESYPELIVNSKGDLNTFTPKPPPPDPVRVMEEDGWFIEKQMINHSDTHNSWIGHYCPSLQWKVNMNEKFMMEEGLCTYCMQEVPPGFIALWQMHNWEYVQGGIDEYPEEDASCAI